MKFKTTKTEIMNGYGLVIKIPYCELQTLLKFYDPVAYTHGQYGWNADIYNAPYPFGGTAIVTGYRAFGFAPSYDLIKKYENMARKFYNENNDPWTIGTTEKIRNEFERLLIEFIREVEKEYFKD